MLGCESDGPMVHFRGTEYATGTCPRRHAICNPYVFTAHEVFNQTEGSLGVGFLGFSNKMVEALGLISDAIEWRKKAESNG